MGVGGDLFPFYRLLLCPVGVLCLIEGFLFHEVPFIVTLSVCAISILFRKLSSVPLLSRISTTFFSIRFSVSGFILRSLIHLGLEFCAG